MESPYSPSFQITDKDGITNYFNTYGYVVVDNVLSEEDCNLTVDEVWEYLTKRGVTREANSWENDKWPQEICRNGGFMGRFPFFNKMKDLADHDIPSQYMAWKNRQNPSVYEAFSLVLETQKLWVSIDRYGIMRPTVFEGTEINNNNNEVTEANNNSNNGNESDSNSNVKPQKNLYFKEEWKTKANWLHWDLSPFHYGTSAAGYLLNKQVSNDEIRKDYGGVRVQGLITLVDCQEEVGGFHCVPSFQGERFFNWGQDNKDYGEKNEIARRNFVEVPENDPMRKEITKITIRRGSLLIWNSQLPHGNFPNNCDKFRFVQYIKMIPVEDPREFIPAIGNSKFKDEKSFFPENFVPSEIGRKLFGIDKWE